MPSHGPAPSDVVLRTVGLTKRYGRLLAVADLDLEVRRGQVYGFLGPNGSGKTTTIGMILGILRPNRGHVELFGLDARQHLAAVLRRTGAVMESPSFYPHLSGRANLRIFALLSGGVSRRRIDEVLDLVGLLGRAASKVRTYSMGMRQRLALAAALMHDPELVVLDEPTNGLDPAGMREVRQLIRNLGQMGKAVFVSSHLLHEVEQTCTDVGILKQGRLLAQQPVSELLQRGQALELEVTDAERAMAVLRGLDWVGELTRNDNRLLVQVPPERAVDISRVLAEHGIYLAELRPHHNTLEEFFLEVTGGEEPL
ncbi:MAG: ABC transporter ATP-binding protein [Chloroflexota bacterium]|nr:ABC transporter ATP-binding protein [Chloroflexota bacterium]